VTVAPTLASWSEQRILRAMRGWRQGCGALLPWFRATPFAAAHHYRDRTLPVVAAVVAPAAVKGLVASLPAPARDTLWIFDLPGALALWLGYELRRRWKLASALSWNGWYDPRGVLAGREEIPLLLRLGLRIARWPVTRSACLLFDAGRHGDPTGPEHDGDPARRLDNRYTLNDEDAPTLDQLREMGIERIHVYAGGEPASDLLAYVEYLKSRLRVHFTRGVMLETATGPSRVLRSSTPTRG